MSVKNLFRRSIGLIRYNLEPVFSFETGYRLLVIFLFVPLLSAGFNGIMHVTGYSYLTKENIIPFIKNPLVILLFILLIIAAALLETWHLTTIVVMLDQSAQHKKINIRNCMIYVLGKTGRLLKKGNILLLPYLLFILPFMNLGTGIISSISIPEFFYETINEHLILIILLNGGYLLAAILIMDFAFSIHCMILEGSSFPAGAKKSAHMVRGRYIRYLLSLLLVEAMVLVAATVIGLAGAILIVVLYKIALLATDIVISALILLLLLVVIFLSILTLPLIFALLSTLYYDRKEELGEASGHITSIDGKKDNPKARKRNRILTGVTLVILIGAGIFFVRGFRHGDYNLNISHVRKMEVSAHRGASSYYPENTMAAFRGAVKQNTDWIELDVQQSSDGEIFVMHDTNFLRTTGVDKNCWEMTWEEISQLDAGSFFSKEFAGEKIPKLKEVIDYAKLTGVRLNIELKPTGHEKDFEKTVVDLINQENFADSCVITSQEYDCLEKVKECDPDLTTVYVMQVALGNIEDLTCADNFSIEATFVNQDLVDRMHALNKEVYAWTIDTETNINNMIDIGVDNIITNNVPLARQCIEKSRTSNLITDIIDQIFSI